MFFGLSNLLNFEIIFLLKSIAVDNRVKGHVVRRVDLFFEIEILIHLVFISCALQTCNQMLKKSFSMTQWSFQNYRKVLGTAG